LVVRVRKQIMKTSPGQFMLGAAMPARDLRNGEFAVHIALVRTLGHSAVLVLLPWAEIEPEAGRFDSAVTDRYAGTLESLRAADIEPVCILWDGVAPQWFDARGGWAHAKAAESFSAYAAHVAGALAPHCLWWVPLAEPEYRLAQVYQEKSRSGYRRALAQMLRAHRDTAAVLVTARSDAKVGLSVRVFSAEPADSDSPWDFGAAHRLETRLNRRMAERLRDAAGKNLFDFVLASWGGVVSAWFSPWQWRREWVLTMNEHRVRISLHDARRDMARFDETMSALLGCQTPLLVVGDGAHSSAFGEQLSAVAARCAEEGGDRIIGFLSRGELDRTVWESNSPLLETLRAGVALWPREMC
jgi:hypothetical protein